MSRTTKKIKRISTKTNEKISSTQKKLRNENEKRRRDLFSQLITNIGEIIFNKNQPMKLSKNAILRQTVAFLREQRNYLQNESNCRQDEISSKILNFLDFSWKPSSDVLSIEEWFQIAIESMNSFFLVFNVDSIDKAIVYVSKNIVNYLAYDQQQLVHRSIYEFIHPICRSTFDSYLQMENETLNRCQLLWKQSFNDDYEQCSIIGAKRTFNSNQINFVCLVQVESVDRTSRFDLNANEEEFSTHLNNQGKFIYLNRQGEFFLGYQSIELIGRTYFDFVHPDDLPIVKRAHQLWIQNGSGLSEPHRFLTKGQQWIFIQTNSQVQINSWNRKPLFYICQHRIIQCSILLLKQQLTNTSSNSLATTQQQQQQQTSASSTSEISSFLNEITDEISRKRIIDKFVKLRHTKEEEIHIRQDEIEVIDDILRYVEQYEIKKATPNLVDLSMLNSPLSNEYLTNSSQFHFDSLSSLFSPLIASTLALASPITPTSNPSSSATTINELNANQLF